MNGIIIIVAGIAAVVVSIVIFIFSLVYRNTTGKKIRKELEQEY